MYTSPVSSAVNSLLVDPPTTPSTGSTQYGTADFMQMLMAQMTHQNPLEPMKDSEMMSQFAQLNSLQELQNIKATMDQLVVSNLSSYAASLIGKNVVVNHPDSDPTEGKVTGFRFANGQIELQLDNDETATLDQISEIKGDVEVENV